MPGYMMAPSLRDRDSSTSWRLSTSPHLAPALTPRAHAAGALEAATFLDSIDLDSGLTEGGRNVEGISCGPARAGFCQAGEKHAQVPDGVGGGDEFLFYGSTV